MALANHFSNSGEPIAKLSSNELRLNSMIERAKAFHQLIQKLDIDQEKSYESRQIKLDIWSKKMCEKIDQIYGSCLNDLKQSFDQLKVFQQLMLQLLNHEHENNIDGKQLLAIEHEICILRCLTYQLDTTKVRIDGKLKLINGTTNEQCCLPIDDHDEGTLNQDCDYSEVNKELSCRLLIHKDMLTKIQNLSVYTESIQMTTNEVHETTPERILTVTGSDRLQVINEILSAIYPTSNQLCELRLLIHQCYAPFIVGKLGDRSKMLREKYSLRALTIHPTCAPHSTERVMLVQGSCVQQILSCLKEIFSHIEQNLHHTEEMIFYDEINYDASRAHEYGGYSSSECCNRSNDLKQHQSDKDQYEDIDNDNDDGIRRYSAYDAWNGSVEADTENEFSVIKLGDDCIKREFWINHSQFGALLGPHGIRIAQIRSVCRTVRIHTVAGSSIDTCSVQVIGPRADVDNAIKLIVQSIKEHDRKFPFKHHRFSGRLR